jgi:WD40 repeat protein
LTASDGGNVVDLIFNPATGQLTSANFSGCGLFDAADLTLIDFLGYPEDAGEGFDISEIAWNQDGSQLVTGSLNGAVRVWDIDSGQMSLDLRGTDSTDIGFETTLVEALGLSADGNSLTSIASDGSARVWDASRRLLNEPACWASPASSQMVVNWPSPPIKGTLQVAAHNFMSDLPMPM